MLQGMIKNNDEKFESFQVNEWNKLKLTINKVVETVTRQNVKESAIELVRHNIIRSRGYLVRSLMKLHLANDKIHAQVLASMVSILNSKFPEIGLILVSRLAVSFRKSYTKNYKHRVDYNVYFLVHLMNHQVCSDIVLLQILQLLLENPTNSSVKTASMIMLEGGLFLLQHATNASAMIFDKLRSFVQDPNAKLDGSVIHDINQVLRERRHKFSRYPAIPRGLDFVEEADRETHTVMLDEAIPVYDELNSFKYDQEWEKNEQEYKSEVEELLVSPEESVVVHSAPEEAKPSDKTIDMTSSELLNVQKTVYLTIMGSMSSDEAVHKLLKLNLNTSAGVSANEALADMVIKCGAEEKTYSKFIGLIGEKLCFKSKKWQLVFIGLFKQYYDKIHQSGTNSVRNIGKLFGHLLACGAIPIEQSWDSITMTEDATTSAGRIFIKFVFQEMVEEIGIADLQDLVESEDVQECIHGLFPVFPTSHRDAEHVRFSINYFTAIGLGRLTEKMRTALKRLEEESRGRSRSRSPGSSRSASYSRSESYSRSRSSSYSRSRSRSTDSRENSDSERRTSRTDSNHRTKSSRDAEEEPEPYGTDPKRRRV